MSKLGTLKYRLMQENRVMMEPPDNTHSLTVRWAVLRKCGGSGENFREKAWRFQK